MRFLSFFCVFFIGCQSDQKELPVLSYRIDDNGQKVHYTISYKNFYNQLGESFTTETIENKVVIANFFFTQCPSICPPMRTELIDIANNFENNKDFLIVTHTIDPENDTTEVLKNYSEATEIPSNRWQFVRSSLENTKNHANMFMTNFLPNEDGTDFYHSSYVALVDKEQQIRGFYNILITEETARLKEDIKSLLN